MNNHRLSTSRSPKLTPGGGGSGDIVQTFSSIADSAKFLGILPQTARSRVLKNTRFLFNGKSVYLK